MWFDDIMQWWKQPWTHWLVFAISWIIFYLPVSSVLYTQYIMWTKNLYNKLATGITAGLSALASAVCALYVIAGIQAVFVWYTTPMGPPLPKAISLPYQPFWMLFIVPVVVLGLWFVIEVHLIRKLLEK